jgi:hypothetical protein
VDGVEWGLVHRGWGGVRKGVGFHNVRVTPDEREHRGGVTGVGGAGAGPIPRTSNLRGGGRAAGSDAWWR